MEMKTENKSMEVEEFTVIRCPKCGKINKCQISIDEKASLYVGSFSCVECDAEVSIVTALNHEIGKLGG